MGRAPNFLVPLSVCNAVTVNIEGRASISHSPQCFLLSNGLEDLRNRYAFADRRRPEDFVLALSRALAASPLWQEIPRAAIVTRTDPQPAIAILGFFDDVSRSRIEGLNAYLDTVLSRLIYVDYAGAEDYCSRLAEKLVDRFGQEELARYRFTAMPRGGLIVLGMLSYLLNLRRDQLEPPYPQDTPLVIVDDCAFTGLRFKEFLDRTSQSTVVFATLFAHPDLRSAIESEESRVAACISAQDLHDHAPARQGAAYETWLTRWVENSDPRCYWIGQPDHVCFPWSEPDVAFWNEVTGQEEAGWRVVPPEYCLKNRSIPHASSPKRVQLHATGKNPLKPASNALAADLEGELIVANTTDGSSFALEGVAADLWRAIVATGTRDDAIRTVTSTYDADTQSLRATLDPFIDELLTRGLLEETDGSKTPD